MSPGSKALILIVLLAPGTGPPAAGAADAAPIRVAAPVDDPGSLPGAWRILGGPGEVASPYAGYDRVGGRTLFHGGFASRVLNETWVLDAGPNPGWNRIGFGNPPPGRWGAGFVVDADGRRIHLVGGQDDRGFPLWDLTMWTLDLEGGAGWREDYVGGRGLADAAAAFDPVRNRILVIGGSTFEPSGELETRVITTGSPPTSRMLDALTPEGAPAWRRFAHAAYDSRRDRVLLYGGVGYAPIPPGDALWALELSDPPVWRRLTTTGAAPPQRFGATMLVDARRDRVLLFGGEPEIGTCRIWVLDLASATWSPHDVPGGPSMERNGDASGAIDERTDELVLFGTSTGGAAVAIPLATLDRARVVLPPGSQARFAPRASACAFFDPVSDEMVVTSGYFTRMGCCCSVYDIPQYVYPWETIGLVERDTALWRGRSHGAAVTGAGASVVVDTRRNRAIGFGGVREYFVECVHGGPRYRSEHDRAVYALSLVDGIPADWQSLPTTGEQPPGSAGHGAVYDPVRDRMLVFGGWSAPWVEGERGVVYALEFGATPTWRRLVTQGAGPRVPIGRAVYDPVRDRVLYASLEEPDGRTRVWTLALDGTPTWSPLTVLGTQPGSRAGYSAVYDEARDRVLFHGGYQVYDHPTPETWALALAPVPRWSRLENSPGLGPAKMFHAAVYDPVRDRMIVHGGDRGFRETTEDAWVLEFGDPVRTVAVDVRPRNPADPATIRSDGPIWLAVMGAPSVDAGRIDPASLRSWHGPLVPGEDSRRNLRLDDVNRDGSVDLLVQASRALIEPVAGVVPWITGRTLDGIRFRGRAAAGSDPARGPGRASDLRPVAARGAPPALGIRSRRAGAPLAIGLECALPFEHAAVVEAFDVGGRRVASSDIAAGPPRYVDLELPLRDGAASGLYFVRLRQAGESVTLKVVRSAGGDPGGTGR